MEDNQKKADRINSGFEMSGGFFIVMHIVQCLHDKSVAGVNVWSIAFFTAWGFWNLYYYRTIAQKWSFIATIFITAANTLWVSLLLYYKYGLGG